MRIFFQKKKIYISYKMQHLEERKTTIQSALIWVSHRTEENQKRLKIIENMLKDLDNPEGDGEREFATMKEDINKNKLVLEKINNRLTISDENLTKFEEKVNVIVENLDKNNQQLVVLEKQTNENTQLQLVLEQFASLKEEFQKLEKTVKTNNEVVLNTENLDENDN